MVIILIEIDILRNSLQAILGIQKDDFEGLGVQIVPRCLLAKIKRSALGKRQTKKKKNITLRKKEV